LAVAADAADAEIAPAIFGRPYVLSERTEGLARAVHTALEEAIRAERADAFERAITVARNEGFT
jgi:hypothetical protein